MNGFFLRHFNWLAFFLRSFHNWYGFFLHLFFGLRLDYSINILSLGLWLVSRFRHFDAFTQLHSRQLSLLQGVSRLLRLLSLLLVCLLIERQKEIDHLLPVGCEGALPFDDVSLSLSEVGLGDLSADRHVDRDGIITVEVAHKVKFFGKNELLHLR